MTARERKERISDLIIKVEDLISGIKNGENDVKIAIDKAYELNSLLGEFGDVDGWDVEELSKNIFLSFMNGTEFESVQEEFYDFKNELEEYMSELSDSKRESMEEKYSNMETVYDMFNLEDYETTENIREALTEIIGYLKEMK